MMRTSVRLNNLAIERSWLHRGASLIAGTDEVGRGAWAGPVVAGMVAVPRDLYLSFPVELYGIDDSKLLSPKQRAALAPLIVAHVAAWGLGAATSREIADDGFGAAVHLAIWRAYDDLTAKLRRAPDVLLTDAVRLPDSPIPIEAHAKADQRCLSVAMASILAKVHRDHLMRRFDPVYPRYDFANNKGYGTRKHQQALLDFGPCAIHRRSFQPVMRAASGLLPSTQTATSPTKAPVTSREHAVADRDRIAAVAGSVQNTSDPQRRAAL